MDAKKYVELKTKQLASIVKINDSFAVIWKEYKTDGSFETRVEAVGLETVSEERVKLAELDSAWLEVKTDMEALL